MTCSLGFTCALLMWTAMLCSSAAARSEQDVIVSTWTFEDQPFALEIHVRPLPDPVVNSFYGVNIVKDPMGIQTPQVCLESLYLRLNDERCVIAVRRKLVYPWLGEDTTTQILACMIEAERLTLVVSECNELLIWSVTPSDSQVLRVKPTAPLSASAAFMQFTRDWMHVQVSRTNDGRLQLITNEHKLERKVLLVQSADDPERFEALGVSGRRFKEDPPELPPEG